MAGFDDLKNLFSLNTINAIKEFGTAFISGQISINDIISSVGAAFTEPFKYLYNHSKNVWTGKPSDAEVSEYGRQLGNVTQMIMGSATGGGVVGAKLVQTIGKVAPKFIKLVDRVENVVEETSKVINASELKMSKTVQNHMSDIIKKGANKGDLARPYIDSNGTTLLVDEIMQAGTPVKDTVLKNGLRWDVEGTFRGSTGNWELVVDTSSKAIVHFNFVAK